MDFNLPADVAALVSTTRSIVADVLQYEPQFHREGVVPQQVYNVFKENGFFGLSFSEENGGMGLGLLATVCVQAELAHLPPQFWADVKSSQGPQTRVIETFGSADMRQENLPDIIAGNLVVSFALSEPHCGSDVSAIRTNARKTESGWVLNGTKTYISNGFRAKKTVVAAYTDREKGVQGGISLFLVPNDAPGYKITGTLELMGTATPGVAELAFDDIELPETALIGEVGKGMAYVMRGLNEGRLAIAGTALGMGEFAYELALDYAKERPAFGATLADFQAIQHMLADMAVDMRAARLLALDAAWRYDQGEQRRDLCSMAKLLCSEAANRTADKAVQIYGGAGYVRGQAVERLFRDVRVTRIYEGASEVQRNTIARQLLKE